MRTAEQILADMDASFKKLDLLLEEGIAAREEASRIAKERDQLVLETLRQVPALIAEACK